MTMPTSNEAVTLADLIRPLSPEAIEYFASGQLPLYRPHENYLDGKFIRLGEVMLIGSTIRFGVPNEHKEKQFLQHSDMYRYLFMNEPELREIARATPPEQLTLQDKLSDAGHTRIIMEDGRPQGPLIHMDSISYGRADEDGRRTTVSVAQKLVGDTIQVIWEN